MKTLVLSASLFLSVLFAQAQTPATINNVTTTTNYQLSGATVQVTLSTIHQNIPGMLHYTFQVYFGDGSYAAATESFYSNDTSFTASHTYTANGTYNITYILGYANEENDGPVGLELAQTLRTINVNTASSPTGLMAPTSGQPTDIYNNNKQLTIKSDLDVTAIQVFNIDGQQVLSLEPGTNGTLNIQLPDTLTPGVYVVSAKNSDNTISTKKIVLE